MRRTHALFIFVLSACLGAFGQSVSATSTPNEVIVKFRGGTVVAQDVIAALDVAYTKSVGSAGAVLLRSRSKDTRSLVQLLKSRPDVIYAEPNFILHTTAVPNDPDFSLLWGLQNTGQTVGGSAGVSGADIHAVPAWDISTGSKANVVAVIDTGVDYNHQDLASNIWSAPSSFTVTIGGTNYTCPAGSHGFNTILNTCDPLDDYAPSYHGTHVSGTVGAVGNNGVGVVGVNWTASIMAVKALDSQGSGSLANAINAIAFTIQAKSLFASAANVRVLSNSYGCRVYTYTISGDPNVYQASCFSQAFLDEINLANNNNMLFVAAAGNDGLTNDGNPNTCPALYSSGQAGCPTYPASYTAPNLIAVAATDNQENLPTFSAYGPSSVHLAAPGVNILSTMFGGGYQYLSGTSMATPHVSGAAALVLSKCPAYTTAALKANLLANVDPIPALAGKSITGGRLDVNKAIRACGHPPGDFDGNGVPDTVLQFPDGSVGVWYLNATGRQLSIGSFAFMAGPSTGIAVVDAADLNRDGIPDLILRFPDGSIGVWYMGGTQGNTITGFAYISGPIQGWVPVGVADLNGDGHPDLLIQYTDGTPAVWYLGGTQGNQIQGFGPIGGPMTGWRIVGAADLDNDGHPDIILQYPDGTIGVWYMTGAQGTSIRSFALIANPSSWSVVGTTDMDGDGQPDLVIRNTDGTLGVWYLGGTQGNQITGFDPITGPGSTNWLEIAAH